VLLLGFSYVAFVSTADLLKKLKSDCIKSSDDVSLKAVKAKLESLAMELCEIFPVLKSEIGTLTASICLPGFTLSLSNETCVSDRLCLNLYTAVIEFCDCLVFYECSNE